MRCILITLMGAAALACGAGTRPVERAGADTSGATVHLSGLDADSLTPRQRCAIDIFEKERLPGAACMIECIRDGSGVDIGGGCWHLCYAYTGVPIPTWGRFDRCPAAGPMPTSPKPVVTCSAAPGKREVRVRLVDAMSSQPLRGGMVDHRGLIQADSLGTVRVTVDDDLPVRLAGRAPGYAYAADSIVVREGASCDVLMRLARARGHGF